MKRRAFIALLPVVAMPQASGKLPRATFKGLEFPPPMYVITREGVDEARRKLVESLLKNRDVMMLPSGADLEIVWPTERSELA